MVIEDLTYGQGLAKPIEEGSDEWKKDFNVGLTKPNLHRRIDEDLAVLQPDQIQKDTYTLLVAGTNSYRATEHYYHDEDSTTSEIP